MIPKIIHYSWFGPKDIPADMIRLIDHWREVMPDYEFVLWNETNFDVSACAFTREAYATANYVFVADLVRPAVLYKYGGIYLDTDIEVLKSLDPFLDKKGGE